MVPLPIDNELDHTHCARHFIEKHMLRHLCDPFPAHSDFITLDLTQQRRNGYCFPDFAAFSVTKLKQKKPQQRLYGFELKVPAGISVNAVAQACRQKALLDAVYLVLLLPDAFPAETHLSQLLQAAKSSGVGVIRVRNWLEGSQYEFLHTAPVSMPLDPDGHEIIKGYLRNPERAMISRWMAQ
jgi:hypothetical protein